MAVLLVSLQPLLSIGQKACVHGSPAGVLTAFAIPCLGCSACVNDCPACVLTAF